MRNLARTMMTKHFAIFLCVAIVGWFGCFFLLNTDPSTFLFATYIIGYCTIVSVTWVWFETNRERQRNEK